MPKGIGIYITDIVFRVLLLLGFVAIILCILASHISPESFPGIQYFGIIAPFIILYNIVVSLYWVIRLKPFVILAVITLLLTLLPASKIYQIKFRYDVVEDFETLKVVSYNVRHFTDKDYNHKGDEILEQVRAFRADVVCFQEFSTSGTNKIHDISDKTNLRHKRITYTQDLSKSSGIGIATYSRYPIIKYESIRFEDSNNCAMWVDIKINSDTIRVFNLHLQTTSVNSEERSMLSDSDTLTALDRVRNMDKINRIKEKFLANSVVRASQAKKIHMMIKSSPYKVIVCGDFNDTPNSYTYNIVKGDLNDAFLGAGEGYGYTFKDFFSLYRIDYIMYDDDLSIYKYNLGESKYSDHYPIVVELVIE